MDNEVGVRLGFFLGVFAFVAAWEALAPRRPRTISKAIRWFSNLAIVGINTTVLRLAFPLLPVGMALLGQERGWGLLNSIDLPNSLAVILGVMVLDLAIYLQHVMFHAVPALWRLHMVHHVDLDFDVTTGLRFHPIETVLSMCIKLAVVAAFAQPALAVLVFEVLLNGTSMFNHGNIRLPLGIDRPLRLFVVTPDMHRVHHSVLIRETNSNFGFNLPWWDRLLGTYRDQPAAGHEGMTIGLAQFRDFLGLPRMLALPMTAGRTPYPINRGG